MIWAFLGNKETSEVEMDSILLYHHLNPTNMAYPTEKKITACSVVSVV